jgi:UDP-glucuronate 4-epimerase
MKVLITGGAGFIAYHLASRLLDDQCDVALLDNFNSFYDPAIKRRNVRDLQARGTVKVCETDILDAESLRRAFLATEPDVSVSGTVNLLQLARELKIRSFIFGSSSSVYGGSPHVPFSESDPVDRPVSPYAATKRAGELLCHTYAFNYGLNITCLRFFTVYGPRQRPEMAIHMFARRIDKGEEIPVFGDGASRRDYTYVDDIVSGIVSALRINPAFEIINLGESRTITLTGLISLLETALGKTAKRRHLPDQPGDMHITYADIDKARRILGYAPTTPIEEGIRKFAAWYLAQREPLG